MTSPASSALKTNLHPRNAHRERYDFPALIAAMPALGTFVTRNPHGNDSIDFADPAAVKMLNKALLAHHYGVAYWDVPEGYLCPPIPGRADHIHYLADLLAESFQTPKPSRIQVLDIGVGANCIYPLLGRTLYGWRFVGSDIEEFALKSAQALVDSNPKLGQSIRFRHQPYARQVFHGVIRRKDRFDLTLCNPPFHASAQEAQMGSRRKVTNLTGKSPEKPVLNFGGTHRELWCDGGEQQFLHTMAQESADFATQCCWFSSLVSKEGHVKNLYRQLRQLGAKQIRTLSMSQGQKTSRIVAWSFLDEAECVAWHHAPAE